MANDRDRDEKSRGQSGTSSSSSGGKAGSAGDREHTFGKGMTSPDSTEAVLDASTGEPDPRARGDGSQSERSSSRDKDLEQDV